MSIMSNDNVKENFPSLKILEPKERIIVPADTACHCYSVEETMIRQGKHILCGGEVKPENIIKEKVKRK